MALQELIRVSTSVKEALDEKKKVPEETYNRVILREMFGTTTLVGE